ncbi:MAG: MotA/TolQ/ExbB proton channel family protein [Lentisphaerae bacterium]|nr:MAG: MotA/TolQ/ExbB proton channel family protein [Lentisphaerota bacterium]
MNKKIMAILTLAVLTLPLQIGQILAQDGGTTGQEKRTAEVVNTQPGFYDIVFGMGVINFIIWLLIFVTSIAALAFIIDGFLQTRREKILPPNLLMGVRQAMGGEDGMEGDLDQAMHICETNPCQLSNILMAGFTNISEGYDVIQEAVGAATDLESEKLMQRIGYLNLCGQIAPMLGLLGTVSGMVQAFAGLAEAGADKDKKLAVSISTALYTTVCGLLIAVPALIAFTLYKNVATQRLLESEAQVLDIIKNLRNSEVIEEYGEEEEYLE